MPTVRITQTRANANDTPLSCKPGSVNVRSCLKFDTLWTSHPLNWSKPEPHPFRKPQTRAQRDPANPFAVLTDNTEQEPAPLYEDQCAIKMSIALQSAGLSLDTYPKARSEVHEVRQLHKKVRGALAAEELAGWLVKVMGKPEQYPPDEALKKVKGRKGIVFFKDFWRRPGERENQGDHIDLWNGETTPNMPPAFYQADPQSYFPRSKVVWFWELR